MGGVADRHDAPVLENWSYNWQTKERKIPEAMVRVSRAGESIQNACHHLRQFHLLISSVSPDLMPEQLKDVDKLVLPVLRSYTRIIGELEEKIGAVCLYWFPETVNHLMLGGYKTIRQPPEVFSAEDGGGTCVGCLEPFDSVSHVPVIFKRRCHLNPLLTLQCNLRPCQCLKPCICLTCALEHVLRNCIHQGKSSVYCPSCRGEICIYDIQEVMFAQDRVRELEQELATLRAQLLK
jgi:hypothetical protein